MSNKEKDEPEDQTFESIREQVERWQRAFGFNQDLVKKTEDLFIKKPASCDCGGYKTYKSDHPAYHSSWCSVNKQF